MNFDSQYSFKGLQSMEIEDFNYPVININLATLATMAAGIQQFRNSRNMIIAEFWENYYAINTMAKEGAVETANDALANLKDFNRFYTTYKNEHAVATAENLVADKLKQVRGNYLERLKGSTTDWHKQFFIDLNTADQGTGEIIKMGEPDTWLEGLDRHIQAFVLKGQMNTAAAKEQQQLSELAKKSYVDKREAVLDELATLYRATTQVYTHSNSTHFYLYPLNTFTPIPNNSSSTITTIQDTSSSGSPNKTKANSVLTPTRVSKFSFESETPDPWLSSALMPRGNSSTSSPYGKTMTVLSRHLIPLSSKREKMKNQPTQISSLPSMLISNSSSQNISCSSSRDQNLTHFYHPSIHMRENSSSIWKCSPFS